MYILAIDTTGKYGSAAVIDKNGKCFTCSSKNEMNHLKDIVIIIDGCLKKAGIDKKEITHIAASIGPGSFTGIRIGVTAARTAAQALDIPCIAVPTLEVIGMAYEKSPFNDCDMICATINARRGQTYAALWSTCKTECEFPFSEILPQKQYMMVDLLDEISKRTGKTFFCGDGSDIYADVIEKRINKEFIRIADENIRYQNAENVAKLALSMIKKGEKGIPYNKLLPEYMRKSEAEMRLENGTLSRRIRK